MRGMSVKKILKLTQLLPLMALLSCLLSSYAVADDEKISISFNKINVNEVIRWAADLTDKTIIVSEQVANSNKPITVINSPNAPKLSKAEAYQAFLSILQANGMGVVETKQTLKIFIADQVKTMAVPTLNDGKAAPEDQIVISILKIKNISASQLVNLLNPLKPQSSQLMAHDDTNILLIADNKSNIDKIEKLVEQIDKVGNIDIQVIHLQYASAKEVASLLQSLVPKVIAAPGSPVAGAGAALSLCRLQSCRWRNPSCDAAAPA